MSEVVVVAVHPFRRRATGRGRAGRPRCADSGTHREAGCITFALHRDTRDPDRLVIIERWADGAALAAHLETAHLADFRAQVGALSAGPADVYVLEGVAAGDAVKGMLGAS